MVQTWLFMNMEPHPLYFSALNNSPRTDWSTKGPPKKANKIVLSFSRVSPRCLIPITPSGIGGNNRANPSESTPPRAAKARSVNRQSPGQSWAVQPCVTPRPIVTRQLRPCLGDRSEAEPLFLSWLIWPDACFFPRACSLDIISTTIDFEPIRYHGLSNCVRRETERIFSRFLSNEN